MSKKVIVVGAGFGGLSAAIRMVAKGFNVTLIDKRDKPGGRGYQYEMDGFKFDGGPTVITAPYMIRQLFELAGRSMEEYMQLISLDPFYRLFDAKGRAFNYYRDSDQAAAEIAKFNPADVPGYRKFVESTVDVFEKFHPYTEKPFLKFSDMLKIMPEMIKSGTLSSMHSYASKYVKDDFIRRVCSFHPLLVGGNPFDTPSIFGLIIQFEKKWGVHYVRGGTGAMANALMRLFIDMGGVVRLSTEVEEIKLLNKTVKGVQLKDGEKIDADIVISNADVAFTYLHMISPQNRPAYLSTWFNNMEYSNSLVVIYFGTKKRYLDSKLNHHNIILNDRYRELLRDIFQKKKLTDDFSLYLHMPTFTDESIAPPGHESFYVLSLVPNLSGKGGDIEWSDIRDEYQTRVLSYLEDNYLPGLQSEIVTKHMIDPIHFRDELNSYRGAAFSIKPSFTQTGWMRPHNKSKFFKNLYFVGAGTHPGAGVPAVMASGKIASDLIAEEFSTKKSVSLVN